ncbi:MAG: Asp-tRNA(Asn)/Glu-tRNA(Gln) amidotransferase subunit GatB [Anaerolineales bacterium]|nr:Asp-tRNA(Asn)/Glu-tRNA(Gln) amidotransferase subunit GatB [Anaerolineales bacterium]
MTQKYEAVIGLEVHAVLETESKMFCDCAVVDSTCGKPNTAVCPVCLGMPGVLPVINKRAVEYAVKVALALECELAYRSIFARKSYFYPDLPKGYQISQYEEPLAQHGTIRVETPSGVENIRVRRVHIEEDTGKLTHVDPTNGKSFSLVDLNRSGVPLLEIVSEPDMHSVEAVRGYAENLRDILRYLGVNSGDLEKGILRIEPNISIRPMGSKELGTRTEIKNLNSFRALERGVAFEIERQAALLDAGKRVIQQTVGWDEATQSTVPQRSKEDAEDYRYFPEPDLPPLVIDEPFVASIREQMPELPFARYQRFMDTYDLQPAVTRAIISDQKVADFFETVLKQDERLTPRLVSNWIMGELFALINQRDSCQIPLNVQKFAELLIMVAEKAINQNTAKEVLAKMSDSGKSAKEIVEESGLQQISDEDEIRKIVDGVLEEFSGEVQAYLDGKETLKNFLFGQVMRQAKGKANPQVIQTALTEKLDSLKAG